MLQVVESIRHHYGIDFYINTRAPIPSIEMECFIGTKYNFGFYDVQSGVIS